MGRIAIVTDSNSGITQQQAKEYGVSVIPMPFYIDEELCYEGVSLSQEEFYEKLKNDVEINTSQPSPADLTFLWEEMLATHDEIVYIPMSSGLSNSCQTAKIMAQEYDGKVEVVNNQRISVFGVDSDEEAVSLVKYQNAYNLASKMIQTFTEIYDRLILETGVGR